MLTPWFQQKSKLGRLGSFGVDVEGVERLTGSHEEAGLLGSHQNTNSHKLPAFESCDALAVGGNDVHAVKAVRSDYLAEAKEILF